MTTERKERKQVDPEVVRRRVEELIRNFEAELQTEKLRPKVLALVPIFHSLRDLGKALIPSEYASAARDRILSQVFRDCYSWRRVACRFWNSGVCTACA